MKKISITVLIIGLLVGLLTGCTRTSPTPSVPQSSSEITPSSSEESGSSSEALSSSSEVPSSASEVSSGSLAQMPSSSSKASSSSLAASTPSSEPPVTSSASSSAPAVVAPVGSSVAAAKPVATTTVSEDGVVTLSAAQAARGDILTIAVLGDENSKLAATSNIGFTPQFFYDGEQWLAFLPTSYKNAVGLYSLTVTVDGKGYDFSIAVVEKAFPVQHLTVSESTTNATVGNSAADKEWDEKMEPLKWVSDQEQYWEGKFQLPVVGKVTTEYGTTRYTNGGKEPSYHGGTDFSAPKGTQTVASNGGRVLLAEYLQMTGYTVVIEHGYGLKSFYYHMDSLDVQAQDILEKGDPVGKVGSTGYSTGPHLHYALLVNNVFIDPMTAINSGIPSFALAN